MTSVHVVLWEPEEWPGVATMYCGETCAIGENGGTTPPGFDFVYSSRPERATCMPCRTFTADRPR